MIAFVLFAAACSPTDDVAETGGSEIPSTAEVPDAAGSTLPGTTEPIAGGPPIGPEQRATVVGEIEDFVNAVTGVDHEEAQNQILEYFRSRPEFVEAGISEDEIVWGVLTDGSLHVHIDNTYEKPPDDVTGSVPLGLAAAMPVTGGRGVPAIAAQSGGGSVIPASIDAVILEAYGPLDAGAGDLVGPWLSDAGYSVSSAVAELDAMLAVGGSGVFMYNGHGGSVDPHFVLSSTTPVTQQGNDKYAAELALREVVTASVAWEGNPDYDPWDVECLVAYAFGQKKPAICKASKYKSVYAITEKVVEDWSFADGALVVLNACSSTALSGTIAGSGNLGAFAGWTKPVAIRGAPKVLGLFFDRLLGINGTEPDEWPDSRPFDAGRVFEYMGKLGKIVDPINGNASLSVEDLGPTILVPSIKYLEVHEDSNELFIEGLFGTRKPTVKIGTTEQDPSNWGAETVVVKIEDTGPTAAGEVTIIVDGRRSNPVPLTEWRGKMFYSTDIDGLAKGLEADVVFDLHLRADVHMYRENPWDEPIERKVEISAAGDSTGPWEVKGSASANGATMTLTGSGVLEVEENQQDHEGALFAILGTLVAGTPGAPPTVEDLRIHAHLSSESEARLTIDAPGAPPIESGFPLPQSSILNDVSLTFGNDFEMEAGQIEGQSMGIPGPAILYWDNIGASFPPSLDNPPQARANDAIWFLTAGYGPYNS